MTREASQRLKLAIAAAQRVLANGGNSAEAAVAVRKYTACASTTYSVLSSRFVLSGFRRNGMAGLRAELTLQGLRTSLRPRLQRRVGRT